MLNLYISIHITAGTWVLIYLCVSTASTDLATCGACLSGEFCFNGQSCELCVPCERRGRKPPSPIDGIYCAKTEMDCGECIEGFEEDDLTEGSRKGKCYRPIESHSNSLRILWGLSVGLSVFIIIVGLLVIALVWIFKENLMKIFSSCRNPESQSQTNPNGLQTNGHSHSESIGIELNSYENYIHTIGH